MEWWSGLCSRHLQILEDELVFFAKFHQHPVNRALHVVFVPLEWLSFLMIAKYVDFITGLPLCGLAGCATAAYYIALDPLVGLAWMPMQAAWLLTVEQCWGRFGPAGTWAVAMAIQAIAWTGQVGVGHRMVEGNNPGMATALTLAGVVLSPMLVWYEVVWTIGLRRDLWNKVAGELKKARPVGHTETQ